MNQSSPILVQFFQQHPAIIAVKAVEIASVFTKREFPKNTFLLTNEKINNDYMFLESGFMRAFTYDVDGNEVTTGFYSKQQLVFEPASFFNQTPSKENIQAITDCVGWSITFEQLNHLFHSMPEFREFGRSILVKGLTSLKQRMLSMINETAEERYSRMMQSNPEILQQASLKHIASYLGITDTSLSRIRKEMSKRGV
ncbi:MAG: Crp/Fnr family transcriptional regulator [Bacteroidota bacterium]